MSPLRPNNRLKILLLVIIVTSLTYLLLHSSLFNISGIEVQGNERISAQEITDLSGLSVGMNLFGFNVLAAEQSIQSHPSIKQAQILRKLNRTVVLKVTERQIWAVVPAGNTFWCLDDSGVCFDMLNRTSIKKYPIITLDNLPQQLELGQPVNAQATDMVKQVWLALGENERQSISDIHYNDQGREITIFTLKGTEIRFGNLERLDEKIKMFNQALQIENDMEQTGQEALAYIDIRFKGDPIIKAK